MLSVPIKVLALILLDRIQTSEQPPITLKGQALEEVESFSYLSSEVGQDGKV